MGADGGTDRYFCLSWLGRRVSISALHFNSSDDLLFSFCRSEDLGWKCITEQVMHHPPMVAQFCESATGDEISLPLTTPQGVAPQLYNWNSLGGNYLPPSTSSSHALPPPSPRDSECAWLINLPVHSLPPSFTWYTGFEGQRLRERSYPVVLSLLPPPPVLSSVFALQKTNHEKFLLKTMRHFVRRDRVTMRMRTPQYERN